MCFDVVDDSIRVSSNVMFFENQYFFQSHVISNFDLAILFNFNGVSCLIEHFKSYMVY